MVCTQAKKHSYIIWWICFLVFENIHTDCQSGYTSLHSTNREWVFLFYHIPAYICCQFFVDPNHCDTGKRKSRNHFNLRFHNSEGLRTVLKDFFLPYHFFFWELSSQIHSPYLTGLFVFFYLSFIHSSYILAINSLSDVELERLVSHSVAFLLTWQNVSLVSQKLLYFMSYHLSTMDLSSWANGVLVSKFFLH